MLRYNVNCFFPIYQSFNEYCVQRHAEVTTNTNYDIGIKKQIAMCKYLNLKHTQNR